MTNRPPLKKALSIVALVIIGALGIRGYQKKDDYFEVAKNLEIFTGLYRDINLYYVDDTKPGELMKKGIDAMLEALDPYTVYIPESKIEDFRFMTTGSYGGIGANIIDFDKTIYIADPVENSPAYKAGLRAGDKLISVNGKPVEGKTIEQITEILKGQAKTEVTVTVIPLGTTTSVEKKITRDVIKVKDVPFYGMLDSETGYIRLTSFTETASREVKEAFMDLRDKQGMKKLVFDLRGNGGGLLREAVNIVNFFVPKGEMIVDTRGKVKEWDQKHFALNQPLDLEIPLVVLIDRGSASASEIVAGSLQDLDRAVVLGERSYGKGLVQQTRDLFYNSKLKVTVQKYYTPSGRCIQKLDYSHRDEGGTVTEVPDSLLKKFKTRKGRVVTDGRGIEPDIAIADEELGKILRPLYEMGVLFSFANQYAQQHPTIEPAKTFRISDTEYEAFSTFALQKKLDYKTETEQILEALRKSAEREKYFQDASVEYEKLLSKMSPDAKSDLRKFKHQIKLALENEIVSRYYFDRGRVESTLSVDPYIKKAIDSFQPDVYRKVLAGIK
ncbi:MAG TPA: S41 family peptidase [Luteibaculaceae bacterium]|nr:S41 family peptidase [Luteibaculaceae bacterium]